MKLVASILFLLSPIFNIVLHDIHISKSEIEYKSNDRVVQISLHIFLDDLEDELEKMGSEKLLMCTENEHQSTDEYLVRYINNNFKLSTSGKTLPMEFIGKEVSEDLLAVWCYLMIEDVDVNNLQLEYQIMLSRFEDQKNIVSFKVDGKREGFYILDHDKFIEELL